MSYRKSLFTMVLLGASLFGLVACSGEDGNMKSGELQLPVLSQAQIDALAGKTFYFAHQSVGYNIVDGMEKVLEKIGHPGLFAVKELKPGEPVPQKGLLHSAIGHNGDPESKMNNFQAFLDKRLGDTQPDMAMLKFCYVDISQKTDVLALVKEYGDAMSRLGEEHPQTLFIYATVPLRVFNHSWKAGIKRLLGMDVWGDEANIKRNEYNAMIRKKYAQTGHLADIAYWESHYPDGKQHTVELLGGRYAELIPEYSDDGKHLNNYGQQVVAGRLLEFLAGLVNKTP